MGSEKLRADFMGTPEYCHLILEYTDVLFFRAPYQGTANQRSFERFKNQQEWTSFYAPSARTLLESAEI